MKGKKKLKKLAAKAVRLTYHKGEVSKLTAEEVLEALKTLPRAQAIYTISKFLKGLKKRGGSTIAQVESAVPLSKRQLRSIVKKLSKDFVVTDVVNTVNKNILGGVRVRIGDMLLDYSLMGKVTQIGKAIQL